VRRWNYRRSSGYGSGHFRPDGKAGEEILRHGGIEFSADRRSVLISTPELSPVQQLAISYELQASSGRRLANAAYLTLHEIHPLDLGLEGFPGTDLMALAAAPPGGSGTGSQGSSAPSVGRGALIYQMYGCSACHSIDGTTSGKSGPTWKGLAGSDRPLLGGQSVEATSQYLRESILDPAAKVAKGYNPKDVGMPSYQGILSDADIESVVLFIESLAN
jgi:mono/diheme cytochrome c family protein